MKEPNVETKNTLNIFLTDAASGLGRVLTRQLIARGHRVAGLTDKPTNAPLVRQAGGVPAFSDPFRVGEMRSMLRMAEADVVVHLAPQKANHIPLRGADWDVCRRALSEGTAVLLKAAEAHGVQHVVLLSYAFLYGDTGGEWVDESAPRLKPADYGDNPLFEAAIQAEDLGINSPVPASILRAGFLYGPEDTGTLAFRDSLRNGRPIILGESEHYSNWIHLADMAQAVVQAAEQQPAGEIFNIVDDLPVPLAEFAAFFAESMGISLPGRLPEFLAHRLVGAVQKALLNMSVRVKNTKARERLGWAPKYATYRDGIEQTLLIWRAEEQQLKESHAQGHPV